MQRQCSVGEVGASWPAFGAAGVAYCGGFVLACFWERLWLSLFYHVFYFGVFCGWAEPVCDLYESWTVFRRGLSFSTSGAKSLW